MATYAAYRHIELDNIGYGKKRVLKPPGGGSSDIFGVSGGPEPTTPEPRRNRGQQASSLFLGDQTDHSTSSNKSLSASSNRPGNNSYQRLFGEAQSPKTPSVKNRMKSNIILDQIDTNNTNNHNNYNHVNGNNHSPDTNGNKSPSNTNSSTSTNTTPRSQTPKSHPSTPNGNYSPREGSGKASLYTPRNPVTGDGYGFVPGRQCYSSRRRDGNPVTGEGYENNSKSSQSSQLSNGGSVSSQSSVVPPSNNNATAPARQRVPPGGFSSGLW